MRADGLAERKASHDTVSVELPPPTRYARRGGLNIAYQAFGEGPDAMVLAPAVPSHLDHLKGVPEAWELFSLVDGRAAPVPATARRPTLTLSDRVVLTAARRAPRLLRALNRS